MKRYKKTRIFFLVAIAGFFIGIQDDSSNLNTFFPIVLGMIGRIGGLIFGSTPKDETRFKYGDDGLPLCNNCHCTPAYDQDPATFVCPDYTPPPWLYDAQTIETLKAQEALNPMQLSCDAYQKGCDTTPSLKLGTWGNDAVCGFIYD